MDRCRLLVEGQTEETFANKMILPHLYGLGYHEVTVTVVATKRVASGGKVSGGVVRWRDLRTDILMLADDVGALTTTLVDFYGLPRDVPGLDELDPRWDARTRVEHVEKSMADEVSRSNFLPHLMLHELEGLLFVSPGAVGSHFDDEAVRQAMDADLKECGEPELVNDGADTAPSKRLLQYRPGYVKSSDGPTILSDIGLEAIRAACPHFDGWLKQLTDRSPSASGP